MARCTDQGVWWVSAPGLHEHNINSHHCLTSSAVSWASLLLHHTGFCFMVSVFLQVILSLSVLSMSFMHSRCHMIFVSLAGDWQKSMFISGVKNPAYNRRLNLRKKKKGCQSCVNNVIWPASPFYYSCCLHTTSISRFYKKFASCRYMVWIDTWYRLESGLTQNSDPQTCVCLAPSGSQKKFHLPDAWFKNNIIWNTSCMVFISS